jgi:hypothetical protein
MAVKRSGHARLKAALVLRDALAAELGIPLKAAMTQLRTVENNIGAAHGLTDGKYLEAIGSVCSGDAGHLSSLDSEVRQACAHVQFSPRYAQYLALMLFTHWVHAQMEDASAFLVRLNAYLEANKPKGEAVTEFVDADLQLAAFWMATAAGKTHCTACLPGIAGKAAHLGSADRCHPFRVAHPTACGQAARVVDLGGVCLPDGWRCLGDGSFAARRGDRAGYQQTGDREKGRWGHSTNLGIC